MNIKVEVKNDLLGNSIFWEGHSKDINQIGNIIAKKLAKIVSIHGGRQKSGMWRVSEVK